jgi:hypothetical protein
MEQGITFFQPQHGFELRYRILAGRAPLGMSFVFCLRNGNRSHQKHKLFANNAFSCQAYQRGPQVARNRKAMDTAGKMPRPTPEKYPARHICNPPIKLP